MSENEYLSQGGDWAQIVDEAAERGDETIVVNFGPSHPSTHGVMRLIIELDGESVSDLRVGIGFLHTGIEKNMEFRTWAQGVTFMTRCNYVANFFNELVYCLAVEKLLGVTDGHFEVEAKSIGDRGLSAEGREGIASFAGKRAPVIDGFSGEQRLFLGWAQVWRTKARNEEALRRLATDPHSPPEFRCNGVVRNLDSFHEAFDVTPDDALYLEPDQRVRIW